MEFTPPLQSATLVTRYKRFLADVVTPEGETLTIGSGIPPQQI